MRKAIGRQLAAKNNRTELGGSPLKVNTKASRATPITWASTPARQTDRQTWAGTWLAHTCTRPGAATVVVDSWSMSPPPSIPCLRTTDTHTCSVTEHHPHSACAILIAGTTGDSCEFKQAQRKKCRKSLCFSQGAGGRE